MYPPSVRQAWAVQRGLQRCLRLPEYGFSPLVLANLNTLIKDDLATPLERIHNAIMNTGRRGCALSKELHGVFGGGLSLLRSGTAVLAGSVDG